MPLSNVYKHNQADQNATCTPLCLSKYLPSNQVTRLWYYSYSSLTPSADEIDKYGQAQGHACEGFPISCGLA